MERHADRRRAPDRVRSPSTASPRCGASSATPSTRSPTRSARGPHRVGRRPPRGGRGVRRRRPGAADRPARRLHGHRRARARSTCSTASTTPRSRTPRCSPSAARCRARRSAPTSSRRSTTTSLFADVAVFCETVTSVDQLPAPDRAGRQRGAAGARRRGAHAARRRRRPRPAQAHTGPDGSSPSSPRPQPDPDAVQRQPPTRSTPAARSRCSSGTARARRRAEVLRARRAARRTDGAHAQGQGGLRGPTTTTRSASPV